MKKNIAAIAIALLIPFLGSATTKESLSDLIDAGLIQLEPKGTGVHEGESVEVLIKNTCSSTFSSSIPVGWIFISETPEVQDLLVVREELFTLGAGAKKTILCKAFCCESSGSSPTVDEPYSVGRMADPELVAVAMAAAEGEFDDFAIQHAVWVISDDHDISSMGAMDSTATDSLRLRVSDISGQAPPLYTLSYAEGGEGVCSGRPEWISRKIHFHVPSGATVTIVAIAQNRKILEVLYDHEQLEPGEHDLDVHLNVLDWPDGQYAIRAHVENAPGARLMPFQL